MEPRFLPWQYKSNILYFKKKEPTQYAVKKKANKKASKIHDTMEEAQKHLDNLEKDYPGMYEIVVREGTDKRCLEYCSCCKFCPYYIKKYSNREIIEESDINE